MLHGIRRFESYLLHVRERVLLQFSDKIQCRRDGRAAEGAGLLNLCTRKGIEGSNPSLSTGLAPLAQLDRALDYESKGRRFESSRERLHPQNPIDESMMRRALALAEEAALRGEVPVGAVVAFEGRIIGEGMNLRESERDPLGHAELMALRGAAAALGAWRLEGATLYVTLEPCAMCAGALIQGRLARVVFGAADPKAGAAGSLYDLLSDPRHNHQVAITSGVLASESAELLSKFFKSLRKVKKESQRQHAGRDGRAVEGT